MNFMEKLRQKSAGKRRIFAVLGVVSVIFTLMLGFRWLTEWRFLIKTDDAYIGGDIAAIAPKLSAYIRDVPVAANQSVRKGDILFNLDDGDYRLALAETEAKLATQKRSLARISAQITAAQANLRDAHAAYDVARAVETNAQLIFNRTGSLQKQQLVPQSSLDKAQSELSQAAANKIRADAQIENARANIAVLQAQYEETASQTESLRLERGKAARDLSFTIIRAPFDGIIGNLTGKKGDFVTNGQKLAALVPVNQLYIDANYKETQLADIYGGEAAYITVDGYDGGRFTGEVLSLAPATGAVFSILPPQNATGNFTKVVQRVPVRIAIPANILAGGRVRAGMSVIVKIDSRTRPKHALPVKAANIAAGPAGTAKQAD
ncbi:MAG: HlyD family secretion protein [Candidatus Tokpelaia sp.]|nr:HlyD family secretion protein [Candidatus Tokpelaia sp.]KAA6204426.1 MAG: HlyD family secretion protein [Candidatus Tokpelaia sp.]KAA6205785.1 MAG: HlyD family secretion protein [Candidatus Tokpelaia sp.]KAA6404555.1 HlyD family secretion protein [Candidatus Tokpelaia sp.]